MTKPTETELLELLQWVYRQTREALFTKGNGKIASKARDDALSRINHRLGQYRGKF